MIEGVTPPTVDLWRGRSAADRAAERRERLLAAATESLGTAGCAATTLRGVCRGAGVSLRYFYESFTDLDALLIAVYDRVADELTGAVAACISAAGGESGTAMRAAFEGAVDFIDTDPRHGRILFRETLASDVLRDHGAATVPKFVALIVAILVGEPTAQVRPVQISALSGALAALFLDWQAGTLAASKPELVDYCTELTETLLHPGPATPRAKP